jgi:hypothetical protein
MRTPTKHVSFRFPPAMLAALQAIKQRDGVPLSEQVRRAVERWIVANTPAVAVAPRRRRA